MLWILVDSSSQLFFVCSPSGRLPQQGLSLPVSGNLWPVLSLESVESTETQEHGVQCQLDIPGSLLLRKDGDIVLHQNEDELKKSVENIKGLTGSREETFPAWLFYCALG